MYAPNGSRTIGISPSLHYRHLPDTWGNSHCCQWCSQSTCKRFSLEWHEVIATAVVLRDDRSNTIQPPNWNDTGQSAFRFWFHFSAYSLKVSITARPKSPAEKLHKQDVSTAANFSWSRFSAYNKRENSLYFVGKQGRENFSSNKVGKIFLRIRLCFILWNTHNCSHSGEEFISLTEGRKNHSCIFAIMCHPLRKERRIFELLTCEQNT